MGNRLGFGCSQENTYPENSLEIRTEQGVYRINVSRPRGHGNIYVRGRGSIYMRGRGRTYGIWSTHVRSGYVTFERTNGHGFRSYNSIRMWQRSKAKIMTKKTLRTRQVTRASRF
ncbi:uncharacterized protein LOC108031314 isoform X3 [Drosophila biarmipes]|uniref:uncharacterized protein LOC108031314 isoform X3 n=1 Tax=Drosophila biarmipes TaxID=125945 RepID=UPI0021CCB596|nr:uncharacterized protein LOC108031314 isoform X3 [Drosophila biarmipes]